MEKIKAAAVGVDTPLGREFCESLKDNEKVELTGAVFCDASDVGDRFFPEYQGTTDLGLFHGTIKAPENVRVHIGSSADNKTLTYAEPGIIAEAVDTNGAYKVYGTAVAKKIPLLYSSFFGTWSQHPTLLESLRGYNNLFALDSRIQALDILVGFGCEKVDIVSFGGYLRNLAAKNMAALRAKSAGSLLPSDITLESGIAASFMFQELFEIFAWRLLTENEKTPVGVLIGDPSTVLAIGEKDGKKWCVRSNGNLSLRLISGEKIQPEEYDGDELAAADKKDYPLFFFGTELESKFGVRAALTLTSAFEKGMSLFRQGDLRLGDLETAVRRASSNVSRGVKLPERDEDLYQIRALAEAEFVTIATKLVNAAKNGETSLTIHKSKKANIERKKKEEIQAKEHAEHKKATRWKNDPDKKELWEKHEKVRADKKRSAAAKAKKEARRDKVRKSQGAFPVILVDDEKKDREKRLSSRTEAKKNGQPHKAYPKKKKA